MFSQQEIKKIKEIVQEFFDKTMLDLQLEFLPQKERTFFVNIKIEKPHSLIGERGQTLVEIQRLLNFIVRRKIEDNVFIDLDVCGYKKKKSEYLKEIAILAANEVVLNGQEKRLASMLAYERRIIHLELKDREGIITQSIGEEPERGIIIKPSSIIKSQEG